MKKKVGIVRGAFLNRYEMQFYEPLVNQYDITAFASNRPFHCDYAFPVEHCSSPIDLPNFPYKMAVLNRLFTDAHYLYGLETKLKGYDLIHTAETYFHYTNQCVKAKKAGLVKKVIATVLENIPFNNEGIHGRVEFKAYAREGLDHMIALTERTKVALELEGVPSEKITVISHFIDTQRFSPKKNGRSETIQLLFCGRLEVYKGVFELLYLTKKLAIDGKDFHLNIVGDGSQMRQMIAMEQRLGITEFVSHRKASYDEMPNIYRNADIYIAPSKETNTWQEQYNTTLLEAQASGLAIVTTHSGGIPENVGDAAVLVQPGDILSLYTAVVGFIQFPEKRRDFGERARERAETVHDRLIGAKKVSQIWEKVIEQ